MATKPFIKWATVGFLLGLAVTIGTLALLDYYYPLPPPMVPTKMK